MLTSSTPFMSAEHTATWHSCKLVAIYLCLWYSFNVEKYFVTKNPPAVTLRICCNAFVLQISIFVFFFFFLHAAPNFLRVTWMPVSSCTFSAKLSHILLITCPYFVLLQVISMTALCITTSSSWRGSRASHCWCSLLSRSSTTSRKPEQGFSSRDALPLDPTRLHIHKLAAH